jgi:hypothetical protein
MQVAGKRQPLPTPQALVAEVVAAVLGWAGRGVRSEADLEALLVAQALVSCCLWGNTPEVGYGLDSCDCTAVKSVAVCHTCVDHISRVAVHPCHGASIIFLAASIDCAFLPHGSLCIRIRSASQACLSLCCFPAAAAALPLWH